MAPNRWSAAIVGVSISVILLAERAYATSTVNLRRIVTFQESTNLTTPSGYAAALNLVEQLSLSKVRYDLLFINALAIELYPVAPGWALGILNNALGLVEEVSEDPQGLVGSITPSTSDPAFEHQEWSVERIDAPDGDPTAGHGMKVAILDTGIDCSHPELRVVDGYNALTNESPHCGDDHGHGTHMAGIIQAKINNQGLKGVAPGASLVAVKVLDEEGIGYLSDFLRGMQWLDQQDDIWLANMSWGLWDYSRPLERATQRLYNKGVLIVAAAGNRCGMGSLAEEGGGSDGEGCNSSPGYTLYPAAHPWVISVGATLYPVNLDNPPGNLNDAVADYSRSGKINIVAPGGKKSGIRILSTRPTTGPQPDKLYGYSSGTSAAAAHVTGVLALVLEKAPNLSFGAIDALFLETAWDLGYHYDTQGAGLIQADAMLQAVP